MGLAQWYSLTFLFFTTMLPTMKKKDMKIRDPSSCCPICEQVLRKMKKKDMKIRDPRYRVLPLDHPDVLSNPDLADEVGFYDAGHHDGLFEMSDGKPVRLLGDDAFSPEDARFTRDLAWVETELNEAASGSCLVTAIEEDIASLRMEARETHDSHRQAYLTGKIVALEGLLGRSPSVEVRRARWRVV